MPSKPNRNSAPSTKLRRSVLVVDDDDQLAALLQRMVGRHVQRVDTARSAIHAYRALERRRYHVLVSDQRMAGGLGSALLTRAAKRWPKMRLVLMSGLVDADLVASCPAAHRVVDKSFPLSRAVEVILEEALYAASS